MMDKDRSPIFRRGILAVLALLAFLVIFSPACRKVKEEEPTLIRLTDALVRQGIVASPFLDYVSNPEGWAKDCPNLADIANAFALRDTGTGRNPLLIKKKMKFGWLEENVLAAPPKSIFRIRVRIPAGSTLEFGAGIYWGSDPGQNKGKKREVDFYVAVKRATGTDSVFQKGLTLTSAEPFVIHRQRIDLAPYAGQDVDLVFTTRGRSDTLAFWFNPVIFRADEDSPIVILVSLDTLRADHLSCYGYGRATSPRLDELASDSVLYENVFAPSPWTLPSHVSLLTGLDEINHGVSTSSDRMDPDLPVLADLLRPHGFVTQAFTGGGFLNPMYGFSRGFDSYRTEGRMVSDNGAQVLADAVLPWLENNRQKTFFLFLHTYQIHQPYLAPAPFNRMFLDADAVLDHVDLGQLRLNMENRYQPQTDAQRRNYAGLYDAEIRYTDEALIGGLVDQLKALGLYDRTMLIVTSDHGEEFFEHEAWTHGHALYNETIRVPLLIKYPASREKGTRVKDIVRLTDIMPTILEELGVGYARKELDGRSLLGLKRGGPGSERMFRSSRADGIVEDRVPGKRAVNRGFYKIIVNDSYAPEELSFFRFPPRRQERVEVYDLAADPAETKNLAASRPDLALSLSKYLEKAMSRAKKRASSGAAMSEDVREELKALGYIR